MHKPIRYHPLIICEKRALKTIGKFFKYFGRVKYSKQTGFTTISPLLTHASNIKIPLRRGIGIIILRQNRVKVASC